MYNTIIKNGFIIDGIGKSGFYGNIGITDDKISYIGTDNELNSENIIDATNMIVCPGFIDSHSHGDATLGEEYPCLAKISQGITTEIAGQCGIGIAPVSEKYRKFFLENYGAFLSEKTKQEIVTFTDYKTYRDTIKKKNTLINNRIFIGHSVLRLSVMGFDNRHATEDELSEMKSIVKVAMENGALGLSSGLIYAPGPFAPKKEMVELCKVIKEYDGIYTTHIRNESDTVEESVIEAIEIAKEAGVTLWISHLKAMGKDNWGKPKRIVELIKKHRDAGMKIYFDIYPYEASLSQLYVCISPRFLSDGIAAFSKKLKSETFRAEVKEDMINPKIPYDNFYKNSGGFDGILINFCPVTKDAIGYTVSEYSKIIGKDSFEAYFDIIMKNNGVGFATYFSISLEDITFLIKQDIAVVGTDGFIKDKDSACHPRAFGCFPKAINEFVKDKKIFTLEEFICKITKIPSDIFKLDKRGVLKEGNFADIVVFDLENLKDRADYVNYNLLSDGIKNVFVNGKLAYKNKSIIVNNAGRVL